MRILLMLLFLIFTVPWQAICAESRAADSPQSTIGRTFSTWEVFEADKCASIWLIKRFVDPQAKFKFFPKGEPVSDGIPFDTPDAELRRFHNLAAFESILQHYQIDDPVLHQIGEIIHDIEVNTWKKKRFAETPVVEKEVNQIIQQSANNSERLQRTLAYFDSLYKDLQKGMK